MNRIVASAVLALAAAVAPAQPLTTAFTFQGRLDTPRVAQADPAEGSRRQVMFA